MENDDIKNNFVVGFAFSSDKNTVILVKKNRPQWQAGDQHIGAYYE